MAKKQKGLKESGDFVVVATVGKGDNPSEVRLTLEEFNGRKFIDIRKWYFDEGSNGMKATNKGIAISSLTILESLKDALEANSNAINEHLAKK
jgi:hypothetical protein